MLYFRNKFKLEFIIWELRPRYVKTQSTLCGRSQEMSHDVNRKVEIF